MSQYITKNKLTRLQTQQLIEEKEKMISILQAENRLLCNVIEHIPGNVFWKNKNGEFIGCNKTNARFLGLSSPEEIIGKRNQDFFNLELAEKLDLTDKGIMTSGKELYLEEEGVDINSQPVIFLSKKAPLYDDEGNLVGLIGVGFDIWERNQMERYLRIAKEKAEASDNAKSQFLAMINHELSTPLASIIGLIDFLKQDNLPGDEEKNIIETIEKCTQHLLGLVNEVLDFSRLEKSKPGTIHKSFVSLSTILKEVYNLLHIPAKDKGLDLRIHLNQNMNKAILTNSGILLQILINLVNNAIKFTDKGHITIQVNILNTTSNKIKLEIAVIDTGAGIPADKQELIFEPFQQLDDSYTRQSSRHGTGLGLAIVKKLSEQLDVKIKVTSKPGQGSTFSLWGEFETRDISNTLTDKKSSKNKLTNANPEASILMIAAKAPRVLLVEDDLVIQFIHKKMLKELQCEVDVVAHGRDAIEMLDQYDIVFVDISLPDISGFEVIKSMRKYRPDCKTPIIALTVHTGKKEKQLSLKAGANKFASKPITRDQLTKILMQYVVKD